MSAKTQADRSALNSQITEAVTALADGLEAEGAERSLTAIAARHACAIALQDAVDHLRHVEMLSAAATARAFAQIAEGQRVEESEKLLQQAQAAVKAALENVTEVLAKLESWLDPKETDP